MNKIFCILICSSLFLSQAHYYGSSTAAVTLAGAVIAANNMDIVKKYKRKDCPVCKGKGWYMSGDNIKKIECQYCENNEQSISKPIFIEKK